VIDIKAGQMNKMDCKDQASCSYFGAPI
jgi:hypothetical protein